MTNIYVSYKTMAAAAVIAFGAVTFSSVSANASTTNDLRLCHANSKERFVKCCETVISRQKKPLWFVENNSSCSSIVVCRKSNGPITYVAANPYRCNLQIPYNDNQGGSDTTIRRLQ